jgi:hypothetical protein
MNWLGPSVSCFCVAQIIGGHFFIQAFAFTTAAKKREVKIAAFQPFPFQLGSALFWVRKSVAGGQGPLKQALEGVQAISLFVTIKLVQILLIYCGSFTSGDLADKAIVFPTRAN